MSERTRTEIYEEVTELAEEVYGDDPDITTDEAMAIVWEELPELYDEYTAAPAGLPPQPIAKIAPEVTVGESIHQAVQKQASQLAWTQWPHKSLEELEWEVILSLSISLSILSMFFLLKVIGFGFTPRESSSGRFIFVIGITPKTGFLVFCLSFVNPGFRILISPRNLFITKPLTSF